MMKNSVAANQIERFVATKIAKNVRRTAEESVVKASVLRIFVNGSEIASLVCTPTDLEALAVGFLRSEGFLASMADLDSISIIKSETCVADVATSRSHPVQPTGRRMLIRSGCGRCAAFASLLEDISAFVPLPDNKFRYADILNHMREMERRATLFRETGGAHTAALVSGNELAYVMEDVGRHNAIDKVLGAAFLEGMEVAGSGLMTGGRLSADAVMKALAWRIAVLASRTAPTSMAIELARRAGLTLVGFARGDRMNVYSGASRILAD